MSETADTFTGKRVRDTYTKLLQINEDNELLNGIGGAVSPTIGGDLNVTGRILQNGSEVGGGDTALWTQNSEGELTRASNIGLGLSTDPQAQLELDSDSTTEDFFIVKKTTDLGNGQTSTKKVFSINNEGTMVLGGNSSAPTATAGGIYYDTTKKEFYLATDD